MIRVVEWILRAVPLDARGRQVVQETVADWRHEEEQARTASACLVCRIKAVLGIGRVLVLIAGRDLIESTNHVLVAGLWVVCAYSALVVFRLDGYPGDLLVPMLVLLFPGAAFVLAPMALFLTVQRPPKPRQESRSYLGLAVGSFLVVGATAGWLTPMANQVFRETAYAALGRADGIPAGLAEQTVPQLITNGSSMAYGYLRTMLCIALSCPAFVLLASRIQGLRWWSRYLLAATVLGAYLSLIGRVHPILPWIPPIGGFVVTLLLTLRHQRPTSRAWRSAGS